MISRHKTYFPRDDGPLGDGDQGFMGVVGRMDPRLLPAGTVYSAINNTFDAGCCETRGGLQTVRWGETAGVDFPIDFEDRHERLVIPEILDPTIYITCSVRHNGEIYFGRTKGGDIIVIDELTGGVYSTGRQFGEDEVRALESADEYVLAGTGPNGLILVIDGQSIISLGQQYGQTYIYSIKTLENGIVLAGTHPDAKILKSTDNGLTWTDTGSNRYGQDPEGIMSFAYVGEGVVIAGTSEARILRSTDYGETWTVKRSAGLPVFPIYSIVSLGDNVILAGSRQPQLLKSIDNGVTWVTQAIELESVNHFMRSMARMTDGVLLGGLVAGGAGALYRSDDNGDTWTALSTEFKAATRALLPVLNSILYYAQEVAPGGAIYKLLINAFDFSKRSGFGPVYGSGEFDDPNGEAAGLVAVEYGVYLVRAGSAPELLRLPVGVSITSPVRFVQTFEKVIMFRGPDLEPLEWNPLQEFETGLRAWTLISQSSGRVVDPDNTFGDGTDQIPNAYDATAMNNRLFVIDGRDEIVVSDILDYTRFSRVRGRWTINAGTASRLNRLFPFNQTQLVAFKGQAIYLISNVYGDLSETTADVLTSEYGCIAPQSVVGVGKDVMFLSEVGYFALSQALDNKLQAGDEPMSAAIQPVIDRINWEYASTAVASYHDNKVFLAVPLDGAKVNNAVLVMNLLNKAWEGYWTSDFLAVSGFIRLYRSGKRRLFVVNGESEAVPDATGALLMVNSGFMDHLYGEDIPIESEMMSRGYQCGELSQKDFQRVVMDLSTWAPSFTVEAIPDGAAEGRTVAADVTRDRRKYMIHGKTPYATSNVNDDHAMPWRQDYSVELEPGVELKLGAKGVNPHLHQRVQFPYEVARRGEYVQVRVRNAQGRVRIHSIQIEGRAGSRSSQERK